MRTSPLLFCVSWLLASFALAQACSAPENGSTQLGAAERGLRLATQYGCHTCHTIPGVPGANSTVGPPLGDFGRRVYAGGRLNTPELLVQFLMDPQSVDEDTPMPNVGVSEADARDLVAFLYELQ